VKAKFLETAPKLVSFTVAYILSELIFKILDTLVIGPFLEDMVTVSAIIILMFICVKRDMRR
jgi:hypothetical protein